MSSCSINKSITQERINVDLVKMSSELTTDLQREFIILFFLKFVISIIINRPIAYNNIEHSFRAITPT